MVWHFSLLNMNFQVPFCLVAFNQREISYFCTNTRTHVCARLPHLRSHSRLSQKNVLLPTFLKTGLLP